MQVMLLRTVYVVRKPFIASGSIVALRLPLRCLLGENQGDYPVDTDLIHLYSSFGRAVLTERQTCAQDREQIPLARDTAVQMRY